MKSKLSVVILAAGKGTRMYSTKPKVLHKIAGMPMLKRVIQTVQQLNPENIHIVYGYGAELIEVALQDQNVNLVKQEQQLGTGHAMLQALPYFADDENILMLYGDCPLITAETLSNLINAKPEEGVALLTVNLENPYGYGRIVRDQDNNIKAIVEEKDATDKERKISEINTGVMVAKGKDFKRWLPHLSNDNAQGEYYITDVIAMSVQENLPVVSASTDDVNEVAGVNNCTQLAVLERLFQQKQAQKLLEKGVQLADPHRFDIRGNLICGKNVFIDINVIIEGNVTIGDNVTIGAGCVLTNATIFDNIELKPYSIVEDATIGNKSIVGPFARLRPGTKLVENARIGNFVEIKKSVIGKNSKVNHLSYVGDSEVGSDCNIGAGVITCNYDGVNKFKTIIGDNVFVGSDVQLIAPVNICDNVTIGAGTTVTKDVSEPSLVISRVAQKQIKDWQRPTKKS